MKTNCKNILKIAGEIYDKSRDKDLNHTTFSELETELSQFAEYISTSKPQALFLAIIIVDNLRERAVSITDIADHLNYSITVILDYYELFDQFVKTGVLLKSPRAHFGHRNVNTHQYGEYTANPKILQAIIEGKPLPIINPKRYDNILELIDKILALKEMKDAKTFTIREMLLQSEKLISENQHFPLMQKLRVLNLSSESNFLFLSVIKNTLFLAGPIYLTTIAEDLYEHLSNRFHFIRKFHAGEHPLLTLGFLTIDKASFFNDVVIELSDSTTELLYQWDLEPLVSKKAKNESIIAPSQIISQALFFNKEENRQLETLQTLLNEEKFEETQIRLRNKGLATGIAILLHGPPGTGKTEIVKQIAKSTHREIMKIDISNTKSLWFGESEKMIKKIFSDYKSYIKSEKTIPILFFNEADAILSKRTEISNHATSQTENAIQNILLEELENFEGILMATTNLIKNLDSAFNRRFLFKISLHKPEKSERAKIWNSKLPQLSAADCNTLADQFKFSGGEIDNIIRKSEIHEIVYATPATFETIYTFCTEECLIHKRITIGFGRENDKL